MTSVNTQKDAQDAHFRIKKIHGYKGLEVSVSITSKWWKQWRDVIGASLALSVRPCVYVRVQRPRAIDGLVAVFHYVRACGRARTSTARTVDRPPSVVHQPCIRAFMLVQYIWLFSNSQMLTLINDKWCRELIATWSVFVDKTSYVLPNS